MFLIKPREDEFYKLFSASTRTLRESAFLLKEALEDPEKRAANATNITQLENDADSYNDAIIDKLNQTFLTPIDREDIFALANRLDDVVDFIHGTMESIQLYNVGAPSRSTLELSRMLLSCADELLSAFDLMNNIKGNHHELLEHSRKIVDLESQADQVYRQEIGRLFATCTNAIELIKWKEILDNLEKALDQCESIADLLRGVVLKYV